MHLPTKGVPEPNDLSPQIEEGITAIDWEPIEKAKSIAGYENLIFVLDQI